MKRKQVLALLLAVCLSSSLLPVPILATEGAAETIQAVAEEGTEPSDSGVKSASDLETEPGENRKNRRTSQPCPQLRKGKKRSRLTRPNRQKRLSRLNPRSRRSRRTRW